jgi:hypothetical protein
MSAVAFVYEDEDFADRLRGPGFEFFDELVECVFSFGKIFPAELVNQRAEKAGAGLGELRHQIASAAGAFDRLTGFREDTFILLVRFVAVRDDDHAGVGMFSGIHLARSTMARLLPLPWGCQMMPPLRTRA